MRIPFLAAVAAACSLLPVAGAAQEKTPQSALAFIRSNMGNGAWQAAYEQCFQDNGCDDRRGTIVSLYGVGDHCTIQINIRGETNAISRTIDLRQTFSFTPYGSSILIDGPVRKNNGDFAANWQVFSPDYGIASRVTAAFEYLSSVCKPKSVW